MRSGSWIQPEPWHFRHRACWSPPRAGSVRRRSTIAATTRPAATSSVASRYAMYSTAPPPRSPLKFSRTPTIDPFPPHGPLDQQHRCPEGNPRSPTSSWTTTRRRSWRRRGEGLAGSSTTAFATGGVHRAAATAGRGPDALTSRVALAEKDLLGRMPPRSAWRRAGDGLRLLRRRHQRDDGMAGPGMFGIAVVARRSVSRVRGALSRGTTCNATWRRDRRRCGRSTVRLRGVGRPPDALRERPGPGDRRARRVERRRAGRGHPAGRHRRRHHLGLGGGVDRSSADRCWAPAAR